MEAIPPVIPYLVVSNAAAAIDFYIQAFGAVETMRSYAPNTEKIMHARLEINGGVVMLADDFSAMMNVPSQTPEALGGTPVILHLQMTGVDAFWDKAVAAGAIPVFPLANQFWGDRYGQLKDPFGHKWSVAQTIKPMTPDEMIEAGKSFSFEKAG